MQDIKIRLYEHLDSVRANDYNPIYLALQGSQNYQLDYEGSDIDTKAIVLPSLKDIVLSKKAVSTTHILKNDEHCDVKDVRLMCGNFLKQNINFLEILFTPYYWVDENYKPEIEELRALREEIAHYNMIAAVNCMAGMAYEKKKAMEHPYPATISKIEKFGYDPKQLHHICRMREFMERYLAGESFENCLITNHKGYLLDVKKGCYALDQARLVANAELEVIEELKEKYRPTLSSARDEIKDRVDNIIYSLIAKKLKKDLENSC